MQKHMREAIATVRAVAAENDCTVELLRKGKRHPDKVRVSDRNGNRVTFPLPSSPRSDSSSVCNMKAQEVRRAIMKWNER